MRKTIIAAVLLWASLWGGAANASVMLTTPVPEDRIVIGNQGKEFVYGAVTDPFYSCCLVQVTLTQGFRLPTKEEMLNGFGTLSTLLERFMLHDAINTNNIVAFPYFNNYDLAPYGNVVDVRTGLINNIDFGADFYDYPGSSFNTSNLADFFFVRDPVYAVPETSSAALLALGLGLIGAGVARKRARH